MRKTLLFWPGITVWLILLSLCSKTDDTQTSGNAGLFPSQEGWNSKLALTRLGKTQAVIQYGHMAQYENQSSIQLDEGLEVDFYDREGNHTSHLTSDRGTYNESTANVSARGRVVAVSDSGVTLQTEALIWNNHLGKIISDTLVQVTTQRGDTLWGVGFESESDLSHWKILKPWGVSEQRIHLSSIDSTFRRKEKPEDAETAVDTLTKHNASE